MKRTLFAALFSAAGYLAYTQTPPDFPGKGWMSEFDHSTRQLTALAEAIPAEKFAWRPGKGVRSTSEVYMHIALGNYYLLGQAGVMPANAPKIDPKTESSVTAKADVIQWLKDSTAAVRDAYPKADRQKMVKFFGAQVPADAVFLRVLVHNHEHMGQLIGYARMNGVAPPWSSNRE
jgi:uncharacterized damage-inducible protein DinB